MSARFNSLTEMFRDRKARWPKRPDLKVLFRSRSSEVREIAVSFHSSAKRTAVLQARLHSRKAIEKVCPTR